MITTLKIRTDGKKQDILKTVRLQVCILKSDLRYAAFLYKRIYVFNPSIGHIKSNSVYFVVAISSICRIPFMFNCSV